MQIQDLARHLQAEVDPELNIEITGVAGMADATSSDITFLSNPKYHTQVAQSRAGAILVALDFSGTPPMPTLRVANPYLAFAKTIELFHPQAVPPRRIHPTAVIGSAVTLGTNISIGAYVVIGDQVRIGDNVTIYPHCMIYDQATIGTDVTLHSHVVIREGVQIGDRVILQNHAVIGADGFGFVPCTDGTFYKIRQAGTVVLANDVEIQSLTAVDRGTIGVTKIGQGTKIDNLVQVGHGCDIGQHTLLCGQVGLAGSTKVGNHVVMAGQAGATGHLSIGDRTTVAARSAILQSVNPDQNVSGYPAINHQQWLRIVTELKKLPQMMRRLRQIEKAQRQ